MMSPRQTAIKNGDVRYITNCKKCGKETEHYTSQGSCQPCMELYKERPEYKQLKKWSSISAGYGYFPLSDNTLRYGAKTDEFDYTPYMVSIKALDDRKKEWNDVVKDSPTLYEYLKKEVYNEL